MYLSELHSERTRLSSLHILTPQTSNVNRKVEVFMKIEKIKINLETLKSEMNDVPPETKKLLKYFTALPNDINDKISVKIASGNLFFEPDKYKWFNGVKFSRNQNGYYANKNLLLHRVVYEYHKGSIPEGYEIHHIDLDKTNNDISNLQCLSKEEHAALHSQKALKQTFVCKNCGKSFKSIFNGNNCFCSKHCRETWYRSKNTEIRICQNCGKEFEVYERDKTKFCSLSCGSLFHLKNDEYKEEVINKLHNRPKTKYKCKNCGKEFESLDNGKNSFCTQKCGQEWRLKNNYSEERQCVICGNKFVVSKYKKTKTCSGSCALKMRYQNK